jgi:hypothetical protein
MTPQQFIAKWQRATLSERSACQQHFLDLCELLDQPKPAEADPQGTWYTFERGVEKVAGGKGWADVWMKGHFGWEYKGKHKGIEPERAAHFLMKLMFCMFGEDTALLPRNLFAKLLANAQANPAVLPRRLGPLFQAMAEGGVLRRTGSRIACGARGGEECRMSRLQISRHACRETASAFDAPRAEVEEVMLAVRIGWP